MWAGESLSVEGPKDAIYHLRIYVRSGAPLYLKKFDAAMRGAAGRSHGAARA